MMPSVGIMKWLVLCVIFLLYFGFENGAHAVPVRQINDGNAFYYLLQYGYISSTENDKASLMSADVITKAVKDFQVYLYSFIIVHNCCPHYERAKKKDNSLIEFLLGTREIESFKVSTYCKTIIIFVYFRCLLD